MLKAIPPLAAVDLVRGQFRGYLDERGVRAGSRTETFAALRLEIDNWRWQGVPFFIRAGKSLPVTCTEVVAELRRPPTVFPTWVPRNNYFRLRISPVNELAIGLNVMDEEERAIGQPAELMASRHAGPNEMDAYERVLTDAMAGDRTLFARQDYVEEAWRIVDPVLDVASPLHVYEAGTWGPQEAERLSPASGWHNPDLTGSAAL